MIPEKIINTLLTAEAEITATVGTRIYPGRLPKGIPLPAIICRRIDVIQLHRPLSVTVGSFYLCRARMRVAVLTATEGGYVTAQTLLQLVRRVVGNKKGLVAGYDGTHIGPPLLSPEAPDDEPGISVDTVDFAITYREPADRKSVV